MKHLKKFKQNALADEVTKISVDYFIKNAAKGNNMKPLPKHPKQQRMEDMTFPIIKPEKVIWESREWLRSISDPHHEKHVAVVILLVVSIIYCVAILL